MNSINDEILRKIIQEELRAVLQVRRGSRDVPQSRREPEAALLVLCTGPWKEAVALVPRLKELAGAFALTFILSDSFQEQGGKEELRQRTAPSVRIISQLTHEGIKQEVTTHPLLVVAPLSSNTLAKVALGVHDSVPTRVIFEALRQRKPVVAVPPPPPLSSTEAAGSDFPRTPFQFQNGRSLYLRTVANWGVQFVDSDKLAAEVRNAILQTGRPGARKRPSADRPLYRHPIITREDIQQLILEGKRELHVTPDTVVTDVAKELAASTGIQIIVR
jgi:hypothetical protein